MKLDKDSKYFHVSIYAFLVIAASMIFYLFLGNLPRFNSILSVFLKIMAPLIYAFILAYLLNPVMDYIEKKMTGKKNKKKLFKLRRILSLVLTYTLLIISISVFCYIVLPQLANNLYGIIKHIPSYVLSIRLWLNEFLIAWLEKYSINTAPVQEMLDQAAAYFSEWGQYVTRILPYIYNITMQITTSIKNILLAVIISIYMLYSKEGFIAQSKKLLFGLFPYSLSKKTVYLARLIHTSFGGFISGKIIDSLIIGILCFIGMSILRIDYVILISVIVGVTNIIPYFGPFLGAIPSIIIVFFVSPFQALVLALFILALQQFDGNILGPKILGDAIGLPPFWIITSVIVGGGMFGIVGMFVGVPVFAVIYALIKNYLTYSLQKKGLSVETDDYKNGAFPKANNPLPEGVQPPSTEEI